MTISASPSISNRLAASRKPGPEARSLSVRTVGRFDACAAPGGGEIQLAKTTAALAAMGCDARPWRPWEDDSFADIDVLHFFGSRPEFVPLVEAARHRGTRVALSTISWFDWRNTWREPRGLLARTAATARYALRSAMPQWSGWRRRLYEAADVLLPNSQAEAKQLMRLFQVPAAKVRVVPNGFDERFAAADARAFERRFGLRDFVLSVGRIEPRKNQLNLIRALGDSNHTLVIVGDVVPGHEAYGEACRLEAGSNVRFLPAFGHEDPLLASAYAACRCLALVGWYETPGLAALEAAATGTPLVVPQGGCAAEYFGPQAEYVPPGDLKRIRAAIEAAVAKPRSPALAALVAGAFTWNQVAITTRAAYELE